MSLNNNRLERCYNNNPAGYDYPATTRSYNVPPILCPVSLEHGIEGSWSPSTAQHHFTEGRSALLDSHDRISREKVQRRPIQKLKWNPRWHRSSAGDLFSCSHPVMQGTQSMNNYPNFVPLPSLPLESESLKDSMTIADVSPRIAVKKVLLLYEHAQYREAATFIQKLSVGTFRIIIRELPIDVFIDSMPHSLPIMEALFQKIFTSDGPGVNLKPLKPESVVMHMVKFFSREDLSQNRSRREVLGPFTTGCKKILQVIVVAEPKLIKTLLHRQKALNKAVEGMGQHGLVGTSDESLLPLHDALKLEFRRVVDTYKGALQKLEDLSLSSNRNNTKSVAHGPAPIQASHQRQLSLRAEEIQDRLIKNKSLLNVVEPTLNNHCLDLLLGILQRRIECDKESLFQFTELRKSTGDITADFVVAPLLLRFARGIKQVLEMMKDASKELGNGDMEGYEDDSSDLSGYHSDLSDSAIMTSGNSPYVSPRARYNFISRSVRSKQILRPSLLSSSSGVSSRSGFTAGSLSGSSPEVEFHSTSTTTSNTPTRPRHIKLKNQISKNNSLVSSSSCAGSESSSGNGSVGGGDETYRQLSSLSPTSNTSALNCVDCVTLVSVPDNQIISQGVNHHCQALMGITNNNNNNNNNTVDQNQVQNSTLANLQATATNINNEKLITELRNEINQLRRGLHNANSTIHHLEQREKHLLLSTTRLNGEFGKTNNNNNNPGKAAEEPPLNRLIREYGALYAQARVETMDALDRIPAISTADELKAKLLFSVVVLAFRAVQSTLKEIQDQIQSALQVQFNNKNNNDKEQAASMGLSIMPMNKAPSSLRNNIGSLTSGGMEGCPPKLSPNSSSEFQSHQAKVIEAIESYLQCSGDRFDLSRPIQSIQSQLWTTLYDYPFLKKCEGLNKYIHTCVNLAWGLSNQTPPCVLEYETRVYMREMHVRYHASDQNSDNIKTWLWPALLQGPNGPVLHKGVVIT